MIEIRNTQRSPIQLMVRSKRAPRTYTTKVVPGIGSKNNVIYIEDEDITDEIHRCENRGLITIKHITATKG